MVRFVIVKAHTHCYNSFRLKWFDISVHFQQNSTEQIEITCLHLRDYLRAEYLFRVSTFLTTTMTIENKLSIIILI